MAIMKTEKLIEMQDLDLLSEQGKNILIDHLKAEIHEMKEYIKNLSQD